MKVDARLSLLGLARRARCTIDGEGQVLEALKRNQPTVVFLASDAGDNIQKKLHDKTHRADVLLIDEFDTDTLSKAIGKTNRKAVAIIDAGFVEALKKY